MHAGGATLRRHRLVRRTRHAGSGTSTIAAVGTDKMVSGSVTTRNLAGPAEHIHQGAMGQNGPVIVPLTKTGDDIWSVPAGTPLTDSQYDAYKAGNLYINVHMPRTETERFESN